MRAIYRTYLSSLAVYRRKLSNDADADLKVSRHVIYLYFLVDSDCPTQVQLVLTSLDVGGSRPEMVFHSSSPCGGRIFTMDLNGIHKKPRPTHQETQSKITRRTLPYFYFRHTLWELPSWSKDYMIISTMDIIIIELYFRFTQSVWPSWSKEYLYTTDATILE